MSSYQGQFLGQSVEVAVPPTYGPDDVKNVRAYTHLKTTAYPDKQYPFQQRFKAGGANYALAPWNWIDLPRNSLEDKGAWAYYKRWNKSRKRHDYGIEWKGRAFYFKNPSVYLNGLKLIQRPKDYINYLKLAPLASFNVTGNDPFNTASRGYDDNPPDASLGFAPKLPPEATGAWFRETICFDVLSMSFAMLRIAQIEDLPDLYGAYMNAGKYIDSLRADMRNPEPVDVLPIDHGNAIMAKELYTNYSKGFRVSLELQDWQIKRLEAVINEVYDIYNASREKMAESIIELSDVDATIVPTSFSTDPYQNPYLVYNQERSIEENKPIFTNVARNASATWAPPEVAGRPENLKYWQQVPEFTAEHERVYATDEGPMSQADIEKYGLDGTKRTNWLPWIVAGGAAAFAATQLL